MPGISHEIAALSPYSRRSLRHFQCKVAYFPSEEEHFTGFNELKAIFMEITEAFPSLSTIGLVITVWDDEICFGHEDGVRAAILDAVQLLLHLDRIFIQFHEENLRQSDGGGLKHVIEEVERGLALQPNVSWSRGMSANNALRREFEILTGIPRKIEILPKRVWRNGTSPAVFGVLN